MKKFLAVLTASILTVSSATAVFAADNATDYTEALTYVTENKIMVGDDKGEFNGDAEITLEQVLQVLYTLCEKPNLGKDTAKFENIDGTWFEAAVDWAQEAGIIENGTVFNTGSLVTGNNAKAVFEKYKEYLHIKLDTEKLTAIGDKALTRNDFATVIFNYSKETKQVEMNAKDYIAANSDKWFLTGKTEYTVQAMTVSKDYSFTNFLEGTDYTATDNGESVVIKGISGEMWMTKMSKVIATYTKEDGSPLTADDFVKDTFINIKAIPSANTNFAMFVPTEYKLTVETAWGDILYTNRLAVPHFYGDYLVCRAGEDGTPDLSDVWVVNGLSFNTTYNVPQN